MKVKLATVGATIRWAITEAVNRALRKRDRRNFDRGMLAGLETAESALMFGPAPEQIRKAREGYKQEMASR